MSRAGDEIDPAVAHYFAGAVDREDMLQGHVDAFFLEETEFDRRHCGEV